MILGLAIGVVIGLLIAILIVATLALFKKSIERHVETVIRTLEKVGPQPRGFIVEPDDEATEAREKIIEDNRKHGRDTKLTELM